MLKSERRAAIARKRRLHVVHNSYKRVLLERAAKAQKTAKKSLKGLKRPFFRA